MRKNNLFALLLAGVTAVGTLAAGTTVQADNSTTVNLSIEKQNTSSYTLTVPAKAEIDASGEKKELGDGINIKGTSDKNVKVTATSANSWNLVNGENKIGYHLYNDYNGDYDNDKVTEWEFTASEIAQGAEYSGAIKYIYTQANADDIEKAAAGTYSDIITFTAATVEDSGSSSGGDNEDDTDNLSYIRVTSDNIEELLGEYKDSTENHIFGKAQDEETALNQAKEVANELYSKGQSDGLTNLLVIYKYDGTKKLYYGFWKASWMAESTDKEYRMISDEVSSDYTIYVLTK